MEIVSDCLSFCHYFCLLLDVIPWLLFDKLCTCTLFTYFCRSRFQLWSVCGLSVFLKYVCGGVCVGCVGVCLFVWLSVCLSGLVYVCLRLSPPSLSLPSCHSVWAYVLGGLTYASVNSLSVFGSFVLLSFPACLVSCLPVFLSVQVCSVVVYLSRFPCNYVRVLAFYIIIPNDSTQINVL